MSLLLVGTEDTIEVPCKAFFQSSGTKPIETPFIAEFTRQSRKESQALKKRVTKMMRRVRQITKEILLLEHDNVALEDGKVVLIQDDDDLTPLTDEQKEAHCEKLESEIEAIDAETEKEITNNLHNIKNLKNVNKQVVEYCPELVDEMLSWEPYFIALREGLRKSSGVYEDKRTKN